jgi:hypothetical protein
LDISIVLFIILFGELLLFPSFIFFLTIFFCIIKHEIVPVQEVVQTYQIVNVVPQATQIKGDKDENLYQSLMNMELL